MRRSRGASFPSGDSLVAMLRRRAEEAPNRVAFTYLADGERPEATLTFAELDCRARAIAAELQQRRADGARCLLLYPPGLDYIAAFFGSLYAGAIAVPAYPPDPAHLDRSLPRLFSIARDARADELLTTAAAASLLTPLLEDTPDLANVRWLATDSIDASASAEWRDPGSSAEDVAFLQYTSGSTSQPRGVMLTHGNLLHNFHAMQQVSGVDQEDELVSWLPLYHDMGLIGCVLFPVYSGASTTLMSPGDFLKRPARWLQAISRTGATVSGGPNFAYDLCARKITREERDQLDLSRWRYAFIGAEPVRAETLDRFEKLFAPCGFRSTSLQPLYGLAEATLMASGARRGAPLTSMFLDSATLADGHAVAAEPGRPGRTLVSCGASLPQHQIRIVDPEQLTSVVPGDVGEIWLSGLSVSSGYWGWATTENQSVFAARLAGSERPWLRTGDLGFMNNRELFVTGRLKDTVIVRGRTLYPQDIEYTVEASHPSLRRGCCAVFPTDEAGEERVVAVQEVAALAHPADHDAIARGAVRAVAHEHGIQLHDLVLIKQGTIPKTSSGKIQRFACKASYLADGLQTLTDVRSSARERSFAPTAVERNFIIDEVARLARITPAEICMDAPLLDAGLDSLHLLELKQVIEDRARITVSDVDLLRRPLRDVLNEIVQQDPAPAEFELEWDIEHDAPPLFEEICAREPWLAERLRALRGKIPVPPTSGTFDENAMFRPAGHFRAFYQRGPGDSVTAVKGADLRCEDQTGFLQVLHQRPFERFARHSVTNVLEYFLIQERKVPGAVLLDEALTEAEKAAQVQTTFLEQYGALGDLPVPLLVVRWSEDVVSRFCTRLLPLLSGSCLTIAQAQIAGGLACYVYYFPQQPFPRVSHFAGELAAESRRTGTAGVANTRLVHATLKHNFDAGTVIDSWIRLATRMLLAGFFPSDAKHFKNGQSIEPQNVLLGGAFADLDSVNSMRELDDRDFYFNFLAVLNLLVNTIRVFLTAENNGTTDLPSAFPQQYPKPDFLEIVLLVHLWERLKHHAATAQPQLSTPPDTRLWEILSSEMPFPLVFDKILYSVYYEGPRIPASALHLVGVTDVYNEVLPEQTRPAHRLEYDARIHIDAAALAAIPRSFLDRLEITAPEFVNLFMKDDATLIGVYDTFLGRIGLVICPVEDRSIYLDQTRTLAAVEKGLELSEREGASVVSLTGLIPSATDYGIAVDRLVAERRNGRRLPSVTTGHATTIACFAMMIEKALASAGRSLADERVAFLGLGSIGTGVLKLLLRQLSHPRELVLADLASRRHHLGELASHAHTELGFKGRIDTIGVTAAELPDQIYEATLLVSATSVPNVVDVARLAPGTIFVDDSAPHCIDSRLALRRFQQERDILISEAGAIRSHRAISEIYDTSFSTGWDHKVRSALRLIHPNEYTIMGCVLSGLLTARFPELEPQIGAPTPMQVRSHYLKLKELGFEGSHLYFDDHVLDPSLTEMFRTRFGRQ